VDVSLQIVKLSEGLSER